MHRNLDYTRLDTATITIAVVSLAKLSAYWHHRNLGGASLASLRSSQALHKHGLGFSCEP